MTRQNKLDRTVIENAQGLNFIVLDKLHTYRGRQGADVAKLMRRLRDRRQWREWRFRWGTEDREWREDRHDNALCLRRLRCRSPRA